MNTLKFFGCLGLVSLLSLAVAFVATPLLPFPFSRVFVRCLEIFGLMGAYFLRTRLQKKSLSSLGLEPGKKRLTFLIQGIVFAFSTLFVLTVIAYLSRAIIFDYHSPRLKKLFYYTSSAILIGFFEELFFRGLFLQTLMEDFSMPFSVGLSSLLYSLVHFTRPLFLKTVTPSLLCTEFIGLVLFGILMSYAFLRTR